MSQVKTFVAAEMTPMLQLTDLMSAKHATYFLMGFGYVLCQQRSCPFGVSSGTCGRFIGRAQRGRPTIHLFEMWMMQFAQTYVLLN